MVSKLGDFYIEQKIGKSIGESKFGFKTRQEALAYIVAMGFKHADIFRERTVYYKDGDYESDDKWVGYVDRVKRKSGYVFIYRNADFILGEDYRWDVTPRGTLTHKR